ncbi:MAG: SIS domain-containing protein [Microbacterium sp.]
MADEVIRVLRHEAAAISALADRLDWDSVDAVVDALVSTDGRVFAMGCGTSAMAAKKIVHTLNCVRCPASFLSPSDAPHGGLGVVRPGDIVFLVSKGGNTIELTRLLPALTELGATIVAVTGVAESEIATGADIRLLVAVDSEPDPLDMLATASTLSVMALMDAVAICLMQRNGFDSDWFGVVHPGGAVGARLLAGKTEETD